MDAATTQCPKPPHTHTHTNEQGINAAFDHFLNYVYQYLFPHPLKNSLDICFCSAVCLRRLPSATGLVYVVRSWDDGGRGSGVRGTTQALIPAERWGHI